MAADNQKVLEEIHKKAVLSPTLERKRQIEDVVQKGVEDAERKTLEKEMLRQKLKHDVKYPHYTIK